MHSQLTFRLLGTFDIRIGDRPARLGQPKLRALMALLALRRGTAVSQAEIVDVLWGLHPPRRARNQIQVYVAAARRLLGATEPARPPIATLPGAYLLDVPADSVDLAVYETTTARAARLATEGRHRAADALYDQASMLWQGPPLGGLVGDYFERAAVRLEETRVAILEQHLAVKLALGDEAALVVTLRAALAAHPLHEGFRHGLMLALYRNGRPAEALAVYRDGRRAIVDELGIEPGVRLRSLQRHILRGAAAR